MNVQYGPSAFRWPLGVSLSLQCSCICRPHCYESVSSGVALPT